MLFISNHMVGETNFLTKPKKFYSGIAEDNLCRLFKQLVNWCHICVVHDLRNYSKGKNTNNNLYKILTELNTKRCSHTTLEMRGRSAINMIIVDQYTSKITLLIEIGHGSSYKSCLFLLCKIRKPEKLFPFAEKVIKINSAV